MKKLLAALLASVMLAGCSHGFNKQALSGRMQREGAKVTDDEIRKIRDLKPQLQIPFKLGICLGEPRWSWGRTYTDKEKEQILSWTQELKAAGVVSEAFLVPRTLAASDDVKNIRMAAARLGADAVLEVRTGYDVDSYANPLSILYLTVAGMWVVPGSHRDVLYVFNGNLWDVGNEYLYLTMEAEGIGKIMRPWALIENEPAIEKAKDEALKNFGTELVRRMKALKGA